MKEQEKLIPITPKNPEYGRIHSWLAYRYLVLKKCGGENCNGKSKTYERALIHGKQHARDINNYISLCISCHRKYDMTPKMRADMSKRRKGKRTYWNWIPVIVTDKQGRVKRYKSITEAQIKTGAGRGNINRVLAQKWGTAAGYQFKYAKR